MLLLVMQIKEKFIILLGDNKLFQILLNLMYNEKIQTYNNSDSALIFCERII